MLKHLKLRWKWMKKMQKNQNKNWL
jgi:hypothetical protein